MPKRPTAEDASKSWVDTSYKRWEAARGDPQKLTHEERTDFRTADFWEVQGVLAKERAKMLRQIEEDTEMRQGSAGAARPAFSEGWLNMKEAKLLWKQLTFSAFGAPGQFEPQQYVSIVCGRPTVVIGNGHFSSDRSVVCVSVCLSISLGNWAEGAARCIYIFCRVGSASS